MKVKEGEPNNNVYPKDVKPPQATLPTTASMLYNKMYVR